MESKKADRLLPFNHERDFWENDSFHAIADLEALCHILVSEKLRIIVYCGYWHGPNLVSFLENNGYTVLSSKMSIRDGAELSPVELNFLYDGCSSRRMVSYTREQLTPPARAAAGPAVPVSAVVPLKAEKNTAR